MNIRSIDPEDIVVWADGTMCRHSELSGMNHMSDDYEVVPVGTPRHDELSEQV